MDEMKPSPMRPTVLGTLCILLGAIISYYITLEPLLPSVMARVVSLIWLSSILTSLLFDWSMGLRNLIRIDVFALLALYFLIYFEFLFPQPTLDVISVPEDIVTTIQLTCWGLSAMVVGRHMVPKHVRPLAFLGEVRIHPMDYFYILVGAFVFANFYMWLAVDFNPVEWIFQMMGPRFSQPWSRGKYGSFFTLLNELSLLAYVIPPIAAVIFSKRKKYHPSVLLITLVILLITYFAAFTSGTRNVLGIQLAGFLGGYLIVQETLKIRTAVIGAGALALVFAIAAKTMLEFRTIGLERYITEERYSPEYQGIVDQYFGGDLDEEYNQKEETYFVDYNLYNISLMVDVFPDVYRFLGWNLPYVALTKPIPRALWPGKPVGLDVGLEEAVGAYGFTIACTFIGEAYVSGGAKGVLLVGVIIGIFCSWWNRIGANLHSHYALIVYSSGFFSVLTMMRSLMFFSTAILPSIALIVLSAIIYNSRKYEK